MVSPACQVKDGAGSYQATTEGVNVTPTNTVTINLIDTSADTWSIECVYTDETSVAATVTAALVIDSSLRTATFTAPVAGKTYIFRSRVNNGVGPDGRALSSYSTTFGVYTLTAKGRRVVAVNETTEGGSFGWIESVNDLIRNPSPGTTFSDATFEVYDDVDNTKKAKLQCSGLTTATTRTFTFPDANTTFVGIDTTQTLTNKTINLASNTLTFTSAQLATACSDETGSGALVFATSPTLVTPNIGAATGTSLDVSSFLEADHVRFQTSDVRAAAGFIRFAQFDRDLIAIRDQANTADRVALSQWHVSGGVHELWLGQGQVALTAFNRIAISGSEFVRVLINSSTEAWRATTANVTFKIAVVQQPVAMAALDINWASGNVFTKTLAVGANAITFSNEADGQCITVVLTSAGGGSTVTWPAAVQWPGGTEPTQTSAGVDVYTLIRTGGVVRGVQQAAFS